MLSCIVLAAGQSLRFGSPKALAKHPLSDQSIITYIQNALLQVKIHEIIIVLGAHALAIRPFILKHKHIKVVYNKDYNFGQTSSFQAGLRKMSAQSQGMLVFPVDYPLVTISTLKSLIEIFHREHPDILIPLFGHRKGHPPVFHRRLKERFLELDVQQGINTVARASQARVKVFPVDDPGVIQTFNTRDEYQVLCRDNKN